MLPYTPEPKEWSRNDFWLDLLRRNGALWEHDGNPKRPYALLTNGQISDTYVDFSRVPPAAGSTFMRCLANRISYAIREGTVIIGQAEGSNTLAFDLARIFGIRDGYTKKWRRERILAPRCRKNFYKNSFLLLIDDVYRSGSTFQKAREGLIKRGYTNLASFDAVAVHRVEEGHVPVREVIAVAKLKTRSWREGENPFTKDGHEYVQPIRPKGARNWECLTRTY